eukprot:CAMPEP_0167820526 /NCGR_PEP_ID=MMETSP0112_2-20121227/6154_1 /TAXON_ID=91324 /ORGANISM="Lotharella globosa, Strain CCCM811" /LENGTH=355 /DNA_ID=CAMNT_0007721121 /DNA_START=108 /DNA_END=1175 /DNA_ORIENTATION=-
MNPDSEREEVVTLDSKANLGDLTQKAASLARVGRFELWLGNPARHNLSAFPPETPASSLISNLATLTLKPIDEEEEEEGRGGGGGAEKESKAKDKVSSSSTSSSTNANGNAEKDKKPWEKYASHDAKAETNLTSVLESRKEGKGSGTVMRSAPLRKDGRDGEDLFVVEGLFSEKECKGLIRVSEDLGYDELGWNKKYRSNDRLVVHDRKLAETIQQRLLPYLPKRITVQKDEWEPVGMNECFRFCRYKKGQLFKKHTDGGFVRSQKEVSIFTVNIYLNGPPDFTDGSTRFYLDNTKPSEITHELIPKAGTVCIFNHASRSFLHDGQALGPGVKYLLRTDAMYRKVKKSASRKSMS